MSNPIFTENICHNPYDNVLKMLPENKVEWEQHWRSETGNKCWNLILLLLAKIARGLRTSVGYRIAQSILFTRDNTFFKIVSFTRKTDFFLNNPEYS